MLYRVIYDNDSPGPIAKHEVRMQVMQLEELGYFNRQSSRQSTLKSVLKYFLKEINDKTPSLIDINSCFICVHHDVLQVWVWCPGLLWPVESSQESMKMVSQNPLGQQ